MQIMARSTRRKKMMHFYCDELLEAAIKAAAKKSGWSVSSQLRYQLASQFGLWKDTKPYLPTQDAPGKA
jgi:hypothetical protein